MDENLSQIENTKPNKKFMPLLLAVVFLCLGLAAGIIGTSVYYYSSIKTEMDNVITSYSIHYTKLCDPC